MDNIGILGGTFDPVHLGHTLPAKVVAEYLSLDKILLIPASIPPHKATPNISAKQRVEMVQLACDAEPILHCDNRELNRDGHSYTVDTLQELSQAYPNSRFYFIIGLDSLLTFTTWYKYQEILSLCHLVVNTRPNYQLNTLDEITQTLLDKHEVKDIASLKSSVSGGILLLSHSLPNVANHLNINISSSEIRQRLSNEKGCKKLLNPNVLAFINKNKLYR